MDRIGISDLKWRKSRYSNGQANCVEVALLADGGRAVRDSKDSHYERVTYHDHGNRLWPGQP